MKKIVMFAGGVETLEFFSREMAKQFVKMGYEVFFYDLREEAASTRKLRKFIKTGITVMITFNFQGLEMEQGVYQEGVGYLWDEYAIPCYNIAADHPYYYDNRLRELPKKYYHISIDREQQRYFREFYPEYQEAGFLPLAGTQLCESDAENREIDLEEERPIDVIMTGNYTPPSFCEPYIHQIDEEYAAFYQGIIDDLLEHPEKTVEETARRHCEREMGKVSSRELRKVFHKMIFIDMYVRNYWRGLVIKQLVDAGITVDVIGKGWEELCCRHTENLRIHPQTDSLTCLKQLKRAKISVNVMPLFKDGAHDRVFNSVLNGAVCVTDSSAYLCGELLEGEGVSYYELFQPETLPEQVKELLKDDALRKNIVEKGMEQISQKHLWRNRAELLASWFEKTDV